MNDPIAVVRQIAPLAEAPPELLERVRCELMATIIEPETTTTTIAEPEPTRTRRRRLLPHPGRPGRRVGMAAAVLVALAGALVVIAGRDRPHDDVKVDNTPAATTATTAPSPLDQPACTEADIDIVPAGPDAPGATEGDAVTLLPTPQMQPCTLTLLDTETYRDPTTGELLTDIEPNPMRQLSGLTWGQPGQDPLTLGTTELRSIPTPEAGDVQCRGIDAGVMYQVTIESEFVGFGPPSNYPGRDDDCTLDNP